MVKCNPWFPDKCSFDLEIWHQVKENVEQATRQGKNIPIDFWPLWALIKAVICHFKAILALLIFDNRQNAYYMNMN